MSGDNLTLQQWAVSFFQRRERDGRCDVDHERRTWRVLVEDAPFAAIPIREIKTGDLLAWRDALLERRPRSPNGQRLRAVVISRKRVANVLALVRGALGEAVDYGLIASNPAAVVKVRKIPRSTLAWTALSLDEQRRLLQAAALNLGAAPGGRVQGDPREHLILGFMMGTGARPSEVAALRLADVHLGEPGPRIFICRGRNDSVTKNGRSRTVPLFGLGLRAARAWNEVLDDYCPNNPLRLFFPTASGGKRRDFFKWQWPRWIREAGLTPAQRPDNLPVRIYDATRHTFATALLNGLWGKPWRIEDVSALLGHRDIKTTQEHYGRILATRLLELACEAEIPPAPEVAPKALPAVASDAGESLNESSPALDGDVLKVGGVLEDVKTEDALVAALQAATGAGEWRAVEQLARALAARAGVASSGKGQP